jgi:hypothetical protein
MLNAESLKRQLRIEGGMVCQQVYEVKAPAS